MKIDGDSVMAVALQQQQIRNFKDLQMFNFKDDFKNMFSTYKVNDADVGTNSGPDATIMGGVKMFIRWLFLWVAHREDNRATDPDSAN